jgi:hypothetical protein
MVGAAGLEPATCWFRVSVRGSASPNAISDGLQPDAYVEHPRWVLRSPTFPNETGYSPGKVKAIDTCIDTVGEFSPFHSLSLVGYDSGRLIPPFLSHRKILEISLAHHHPVRIIQTRRQPAPPRPAGAEALVALARLLARQAAAETSRDFAISITPETERAP